MNHIIAKTPQEITQVEHILQFHPPMYRLAYSDRMAWLMSCFSTLAYVRFNPPFANDDIKDLVLEQIEKVKKSTQLVKLQFLIDAINYDHKEEKQLLMNEINTLNGELVATFDQQGTQAILVTTKRFIILAFRGTEATSISDIKSDTRAKLVPDGDNSMIHEGFRDAFAQVHLDIQQTLNQAEYQQKPLLITGHSLGGALATVAAKKLTHQAGIAACYTFGSPRVGDEEWITNIKTPIYRLVNAADIVTMMPPGDVPITILSWLVQFIPLVGKKLRKFLISSFSGYLHAGNMRYLTNCDQGQYQQVKLLYSVSLAFRLKAFIQRSLPWGKFLSDHSINIYRKKLIILAERGIKQYQNENK